jgi:hypothetical protein
VKKTVRILDFVDGLYTDCLSEKSKKRMKERMTISMHGYAWTLLLHPMKVVSCWDEKDYDS